jgi:hypothetical protein
LPDQPTCNCPMDAASLLSLAHGVLQDNRRLVMSCDHIIRAKNKILIMQLPLNGMLKPLTVYAHMAHECIHNRERFSPVGANVREGQLRQSQHSGVVF